METWSTSRGPCSLKFWKTNIYCKLMKKQCAQLKSNASAIKLILTNRQTIISWANASQMTLTIQRTIWHLERCRQRTLSRLTAAYWCPKHGLLGCLAIILLLEAIWLRLWRMLCRDMRKSWKSLHSCPSFKMKTLRCSCKPEMKL